MTSDTTESALELATQAEAGTLSAEPRRYTLSVLAEYPTEAVRKHERWVEEFAAQGIEANVVHSHSEPVDSDVLERVNDQSPNHYSDDTKRHYVEVVVRGPLGGDT